MICPNPECGKQNSYDNVFCEYCGSRLSAIPEPPEPHINIIDMVVSFEKSWKKLQRKVKVFANDIYRFRNSLAINPAIEKYFKKHFQKRILPLLKHESISSEQEKAICDFVNNFSFTDPDFFPHDEIDTYKGYVFIVVGIIGFLVCIFVLNEPILSIVFLLSFLINGLYDLRRKSAGLAYVNQLDSVYQEIKSILVK